jgi:hypothetical protein
MLTIYHCSGIEHGVILMTWMTNGNTSKGLDTEILSFLRIHVKQTRINCNKWSSCKGYMKYFHLSLIFSHANSHNHRQPALAPSLRNSCTSAKLYFKRVSLSTHSQCLLLSESHTIPDPNSMDTVERGWSPNVFFSVRALPQQAILITVISNMHKLLNLYHLYEMEELASSSRHICIT